MALPPFSSSTPQASFTRSGKVKQTVYNVMDYGAKGDGTTDDTTAIQNTINAASGAGGGIIQLPPKTFLLNSSAVTLASSTIIQGSGKNSTMLKVGASFTGTAMLYKIVSTSNGSFNDWCLRDLTIDGTNLSSSVRGLQIDTSAFNSILYYDLLVENVCFQNCYIGAYQGGNNANAAGQSCGFTLSNCSFIGNSYGFVFKGTYGTWLDHIFFANNSISACQTKDGAFTTAPSGTNPGAGPTTIVKMTNCDVENTDTNVDFVNGVDQGILIEASMATFDNIYVSGVSQVPFMYQNAEPNEHSSLSNIKLRYAGGGLVLAAPGGGNFNTGGLVTNFTIWRCGQKTNWSSFPQRQSHLYIYSGSWIFDTGEMLVRNNDIAPPYAISIGSSDNTVGTLRFSNVWIPPLTDGGTPTANYANGIYTVWGLQSNLDIAFQNCPGVTENKVSNNLQSTSIQTSNLMLPDSSLSSYSLSSNGTNGNNVSIPNSSSLQFIHNMTLSAWVYVNTLPASDCVLMERASASGNTNYMNINSDGSVEFGIHDSTGWSHPSSSQKITTGAWHLVVMTYATGVAQVGYIDSVPQINVSMVGRDTLSGSSAPVYIGAQYDGTLALNGLVKDIRIWNVALTASQVQGLYYNIIPTSGLVGEWKFGEGSGTTANDTSGNSNTGTINGTMTFSTNVPTNTTFVPINNPRGRTINSVSSATAAASSPDTDYVYFVSGTTTLTMPTAVNNTNKYTVKNAGSNTVTIATTSAQTIDGSGSASLPVANTSLDLVSDNSNWRIV